MATKKSIGGGKKATPQRNARGKARKLGMGGAYGAAVVASKGPNKKTKKANAKQEKDLATRTAAAKKKKFKNFPKKKK